MKKILLSLACAMSLGTAFAGTGTQADPYTVADVIAQAPTQSTDANAPQVYVKGIIVGWVDGQKYTEGANFNATATSQTNILIADAANVTDPAVCVPVQLPAGSVRSGLNLQQNPDNYKKEVILQGQVLKYFGVPGVKTTKSYQIVGAEVPEDITVANIGAFLSTANTKSKTTISGATTAVYQNGRYLWIQDATGKLLVYAGNDAITTKYTNGMTIAGGITGTYSNFSNGLLQMSDPVGDTFKAGTAGTAVQPELITCEDVATDLVNTYVTLKGVNITAGTAANTYDMTDATEVTVALYNQFANAQYYDVVEVITGTNLNVEGFISVHNGVAQVVPTKVTTASGREVVATPTFSVASGAVAEGTKVEIKCATEGATIVYAIADEAPTATLYTEPIVISKAMTITAYAYKEGMDDSATATATYTIAAPIDPTAGAFFNFAEPATLSPAQEVPAASTAIELPGVTFTSNNITLVGEGGGTTVRLWSCGSPNHGVEYRVYNGGTVTISGTGIKSIDITGDKLSTLGATTGTMTAETTKATWTADSEAGVSQVVITVTTKGNDKRADFSTVKVNTIQSGIEGVVADDNAPVEYFNLQGVRVANPENGLYIRRQGNKVSKIYVR